MIKKKENKIEHQNICLTITGTSYLIASKDEGLK
jgi:hypothetical protein